MIPQDSLVLQQTLETINARIDTLQQCVQGDKVRIEKIETQVTTLSRDVAVFESILQSTAKVQEKLAIVIEQFANTLTEIKLAMVQIQTTITGQSEHIKVLSGRIQTVEGTAKEVQERGHFDFIDFVKKNLVTILLAGGSLWAIIQSIIDASK